MNRNKARVIPVKAIQNAPDVRCTDQEKLAATYCKHIIEERCNSSVGEGIVSPKQSRNLETISTYDLF